ncbi:hypothetical protein ACSVDA_03175 [Cytobacillus sp. Hm23]
MKNIKLKKVLLAILVISIGFNLYFVGNWKLNRDRLTNAQFGKIEDGIEYAYNFGDILQRKWSETSTSEKVEYLTAMTWSLYLSVHMLEVLETNNENYIHLEKLLSIYSHIPLDDIGVLVKARSVIDEEVLGLLHSWLEDMEFLKRKINFSILSNMSNKEFESYFRDLLKNLKYEDDELNKVKKTFEHME